MTRQMTGAEIVVQALRDQGVDTVFGYPGGAVLPIYDVLFQQNDIRHILVRHEQGATHAAEGYARSTGKPGVVLVTSGPGATNAVTGMTDALMDSIPMIVLTGQVPTFMIGNDAFQEADTVGITRPCTKHNWLVKDTEKLAETIHQAFHVATRGRPGPVLVDIPKDVQFATGRYVAPGDAKVSHYQPRTKGDPDAILAAVEALEKAERPIVYSGGGVINSGPEATRQLRALAQETGFPLTSTLMGLGAYPASGRSWVGMLGMHGTYEANWAMHDCDVMLCIGARFDDRITGRTDAFSPGSLKVHIDIDPSSINKNIHVQVPIVGDIAAVLGEMLALWRGRGSRTAAPAVAKWWKQIELWRGRNCLAYRNSATTIKPQYALQRLEALTAGRDRYICTEVGQHQMWAAQYLTFEEPNRWMTSGGLGTMGYGFPASIGVQVAHPEALVINVAGEASWLMNMQEMGTAVQYRLPVKQFILNNERLGMVRQWQELLHGERYSSSWSEALPDFVKLAEAFGAKGILVTDPARVDDAIREMLDHPGPVIVDCVVEKHENCFPMIPSGKAHNEMLLGEDATQGAIDSGGAVLVDAGGREMFTAAVVQQPPNFLDLPASLERAAALVAEAAGAGAALVVFPEAWFPGYPTWVWRLRPGEDMAVSAEMHALLARNAINAGAGGLAPLQEIARAHGVVLVAGFNEIDARSSGSTLYNSVAVIDADGRVANHHRKLMPTNPERMVWGFGDGSTLRVVDTAVGRIGALLCWENYMPLARYALYAQRVEIYVAPTWDTGESWLATMRHIAREAGAWVIGCSTPMQAADVPPALPHREKLFPDPDEWINDGDAVVHRPFGPAVAGPMHREKGLLFANIDPAAVTAARRSFDAAGHYARPDVFTLTVNRAAQHPVVFADVAPAPEEIAP